MKVRQRYTNRNDVRANAQNESTENNINQNPFDNKSQAGILSTMAGTIWEASLIILLACTHANQAYTMTIGFAGVVAAAITMAGKDYVALCMQVGNQKMLDQRRVEKRDENPLLRHTKLSASFQKRGIDAQVAALAATQVIARESGGAQAAEQSKARNSFTAFPLLTALRTAGCFLIGAIVPLSAAMLVQSAPQVLTVGVSSLSFLAILSATALNQGHTKPIQMFGRITLWGISAIAASTMLSFSFSTWR